MYNKSLWLNYVFWCHMKNVPPLFLKKSYTMEYGLGFQVIEMYTTILIEQTKYSNEIILQHFCPKPY